MVSVADLQGIDEEATEAGVKMFGIHKQTGAKVYGRGQRDDVERVGSAYRIKGKPEILVDARQFQDVRAAARRES